MGTLVVKLRASGMFCELNHTIAAAGFAEDHDLAVRPVWRGGLYAPPGEDAWPRFFEQPDVPSTVTISTRNRDPRFRPYRYAAPRGGRLPADRGGNAWAHWKRVLAWLLDRAPERILICQDDIVACRGLRVYLETRPWPAEAAWLSAYTARKYRHPDARGWHRKDGRGGNLCGALCMIFAPEAARELLQDPMIAASNWTGPALGKRGTPAYLDTCCIDGKCGAWAHQHKRKVYYHTPSLVEHIGVNNSSMNSPGNRRAARSADFVGEDWVPERKEQPA